MRQSTISDWQGGEISISQISTGTEPDGSVRVRLMDNAGHLLFEAHIAPENYAAFALRQAATDCTYRQ